MDQTDIFDHRVHLLLFLSAVTEPAMLLLLSKVNCPVDPVGSVNTRNHFEALDHPRLVSTLRDHIKNNGKTELSVQASLGEEVQKVKRGWEVTIVVDLVSGSDPLYRQSFTFLQFAKHRQPPQATTTASSETETETSGEIKGGGRADTIRVLSVDPGRWATLSKDYNPIHFFSSVAKLFGFKQRIAHGNQVLAKAITELYTSAKSQKSVSSLTVEFRRPVFVPSELEVRENRDRSGVLALEIGSGDKVQVIARCSP
jgi:acyl dehydratase